MGRVRSALTMACVVALAGGAVQAGSEPRAGAVGVAGAQPAKWDPRIAELADFVEHRRGLDFEHPVPVKFLTERQFQRALKVDRRHLSRLDNERLDELAATLRALGLLRGDANQLLEPSPSILAFYDPDKKEIVVRGKDPDASTNVTLVHELTHVVQDQHFDLNKLMHRTRHGAEMAVIALIEGDAIRTEIEYVRTLSQSDQQAYVDESDQQARAAEGAPSSNAPAVLTFTGGVPYELGPTFVEAIAAKNGEKAIDSAFRKPPTSDEQVLTPSTYLDSVQPKSPDPPSLRAGDTKHGKAGTLGAFELFATLMLRLPPEVALHAAEGWGGDSLIRFERDGADCVGVAFTGDTVSDTDAITGALDQWAALGPRGAAGIERSGAERITFTSCDPSSRVVGGEATFRDGETKVLNGATVLRTRAFYFGAGVASGDPMDKAQCVADDLALDPLVRTFFETSVGPDEGQVGEITDRIRDARSACGI